MKTHLDILEQAYCDPTKRMDFILYFYVKDGNPNGDPDAGNLPRIDPTDNHGIVTDVATKRKIRDYFQATLERPIFIQNKTALNSLYFETAQKSEADDELKESEIEAIKSLAVFLTESDETYTAWLSQTTAIKNDGDEEEKLTGREILERYHLNNIDFNPETNTLGYLGEGKDIKNEITEELDIPDEVKKSITQTKTGLAAIIANAKNEKKKAGRDGRDAMKKLMCKHFDDIRLFGAVLTAGTNAGQIRGPMQLTFARSLEPVIPLEASITRKAITKASDFLKKETEMGRKPWLPWAVYEQHGFYNAPLGAERTKGGTGVTKEDLARFWEALANMFREVKSAANGEMEAVDLVVFVHDDEKGRSRAPFYMLSDKVKLKPKAGADPTSKNFSTLYESLRFEDEEKLQQNGISIHRPFQDLRPNL